MALKAPVFGAGFILSVPTSAPDTCICTAGLLVSYLPPPPKDVSDA